MTASDSTDIGTFSQRVSRLAPFALRIVLFLGGAALLYGPLLETVFPRFLVDRKSDIEIHIRRQESRTPTEASRVVIGDSVTQYLYWDLPDHKVVTLWQGMSLVGQYINLESILQTNRGKIKAVSLAVVPQSLNNNLDYAPTYTDLVRVFYTRDDLRYFDETATRMLGRLPITLLTPYFSVLKASDLVIPDYSVFNPNPPPLEPFVRHAPYISEVSAAYLKKMRARCAEEGARFRVVPNPLSETASRNFERLKRDIALHGLQDVFEGFFDRLVILPPSVFRADGIHPTDAYLAENKQVLLQKMGAWSTDAW